ncbi:MAG TPA: DUF3108 domain-containing protein [Candidatus Acidoferrales bacterium]|jgi:hypothetical protein|nr:DUF3108 domain-containing protein [Candidatus Acidoferrales bacterium]
MPRIENWRKREPIALVLTAAAAMVCVLAAGGQAPKSRNASRHAATKTEEAKAAKPVTMPFRIGETLNFRVSWSAFSNAASVQMTVPEQRDLYGYSTWHFRAQVHTVSPVRSLFSIDDQFDSYADRSTLDARQYETHLDELGKIQDQMFRFTAPGQAPRLPGPNIVVPAGTLDPLGALYVLRHVDWVHMPEFGGTIYDGHDLYAFSAKRQTTDENVTVGAGSFATTQVAIDLYEHQKPVPGVHLVAWVANDDSRTPVLLQAQLPFGNIRAELTSLSQ